MDEKISRRSVVKAIGAGTALGVLGMPAIARAADSIKVGYLHTLAVDGQLWLADHEGYWKEQKLAPQFVKFTTGLQLFQAMIGGSIDMLVTGAVISNFPARGQGKAFLMNDIEFATAQLWVNPAKGVSDWKDLKGKTIATTLGTTAHVFLATALKAHGLTPDKDVKLLNQTMSQAVTSFISGAVPAVALWVPFNISVEKQLPDAKMIDDASHYYPQAAIMDGWACQEGFMKEKPDILKRVIKAWQPANDFLVEKPDEALKIIQEKYYPKVPLADLKVQYKAEKVFDSKHWVELFKNGQVTKWLQQVTDFYVSVGGISNPVPAKDYFVPDFYLDVVKA
ncbi:MAG TPA: ABC transporter substrate-binding protein [Rhizobiaceae bacterium]|nr:ABC transporter substrate-binding protein [Rhizobiaceae bacterium]